MLFLCVCTIENSAIDRPLNHVVTIVEQEAAELHIAALLGLCDHRQIEEDEDSHVSSCVRAHLSKLAVVKLQTTNMRQENFVFAAFKNAYQAFHGKFNRRERGRFPLRHIDIDMQ